MAGLAKATLRVAGKGAKALVNNPLTKSLANNSRRAVADYAREFGFLGNVIGDAVDGTYSMGGSFRGSNKGKGGGSQLGALGSNTLLVNVLSSMVGLLQSIDANIKGILSEYQKDDIQDAYNKERLISPDRISPLLSGDTGEKKSGKGLFAVLLGIFGGIVTAVVGLFKSGIGLIVSSATSLLTGLVSKIGGLFTDLIRKLIEMAAASRIANGLPDIDLPGRKKPGGIPKPIPTKPSRIPGIAGVVGGAAASLGLAGYQYYNSKKGLDDALASGEISQEEYDGESKLLKAQTGGTVIGSGLGMAAGAVLGPLGMIGGSVLGGLVGEKIGEGMSRFADATSGNTSPRDKAISEEEGKKYGLRQDMGGIDYEGYKERLAKQESSGNYGAINTLGFLGKYQFGADTLAQYGVMKPKPKDVKNLEWVNNPKAWREGYSKDDFLKNKELQEEIMVRFTRDNYREGVRLGVIKKDDTREVVAGKLATRHLLGWGKKDAQKQSEFGARHFWEGSRNSTDAYGTSAAKYANLGIESQRSTTSMLSSVEGPSLNDNWDSITNRKANEISMSSMAAEVPKPIVVQSAPSAAPTVINNNVMGGGRGSTVAEGVPSISPMSDDVMAELERISRFGF